MDWLVQQAHSASPFIATFCLLIGAAAVKLYLAERKLNRVDSRAYTAATVKTARVIEKLASGLERSQRRTRKRKSRSA